MMLEKYPLCNHCLGRQFAMLGHGMENHERGRAIKATLALKAHREALGARENKEAIRTLKALATNGFHEVAEKILYTLEEHIPEKNVPRTCFLCDNRFELAEMLAKKVLEMLDKYEYHNFLVGIRLPVLVEEREDELKAEFDVAHGENMRNEFGRTIGKIISEHTGKIVEHKKPEVVVLVNPMKEEVELQVNPIYVAGYYKKLVRGIPQSKWLCSGCRGKGCDECNGTGKLYPESVAEIIERPFFDETGGVSTVFHASGREDIDVRMLGNGRPFIIEIKKPKKRVLNLKRLEKSINSCADGKIEVSNLRPADRDMVREFKKSEAAKKEYLVTLEFDKRVSPEDLRHIKERLTGALVRQRTPLRVLHRRADLTRERYIYDVKIKKLSPKKAEMKIRCQGGLYVKELVTGDEGRTKPSVSQLLGNKAEPKELDVLKVIIGD